MYRSGGGGGEGGGQLQLFYISLSSPRKMSDGLSLNGLKLTFSRVLESIACSNELSKALFYCFPIVTYQYKGGMKACFISFLKIEQFTQTLLNSHRQGVVAYIPPVDTFTNGIKSFDRRKSSFLKFLMAWFFGAFRGQNGSHASLGHSKLIFGLWSSTRILFLYPLPP